MSRFGELLKEARKRTKLTQQELGGKVPVDGSYISKMETGKESPPTRYVAVKLADALGMSEKSRRWLDFLLAAGVASAEDMEGFAVVKIEDNEPEEEDQVSGASPPNMAHPALDIQNVLLGPTGKEIERLLGLARLSEEEEKWVSVEIIEFTKRQLALIEKLCKREEV